MHVDLLDQVPKFGTQRRNVMRFIAGLSDHSDTPGDFTDKDATMRDRQVKIIGDFAVTYWVDEAVKAVMVIDVSKADR